ncbi:MAG: glycosyl hydrolase family 57 [Dactylosporangium sp.]|nr:hypothetical protein [Dactylosporangium sp.]NNJ63788.1 glycosyl hydrolase family 57 [Dactylosporangium sp.]
MWTLPEYVGDLPNLCGREAEIQEAIDAGRGRTVYSRNDATDLRTARSVFAIGLHMHQPLIPADGHDLRDARIISNLQWMMEHQDIHDNHNAPAFRWCYQRMGDFIPQLLAEGYHPRAMLEYSGTLLHGLRAMGADDVIDVLRAVTCEPKNRDAVEWLGCTWGHAVAPSTPVQDYRLHVRAWQHHFAAIFGLEALSRVRGFFPAEMALPNHPDVAYEFVTTLNDCGYQWVMVQEHTVELPSGHSIEQRHLPHRLVCTNSRGETAEIIAIIKTQGSDNKLVAQMQPYYEAKGLARTQLAGHEVPQLVTQAADGENGGVMMNEFPAKYHEVVRECSGTDTPIVNVTEYLEQLFDLGIGPADLPAVQPVGQHRIWETMKPGKTGAKRLPNVIAKLRAADDRFHVDGGSWTNDISWVRGYDNVMVPMERASARFSQAMLAAGSSTDDPRYRDALFHLLTAETSCYRYWGQGVWTDYGAELARRATDAIGGG